MSEKEELFRIFSYRTVCVRLNRKANEGQYYDTYMAKNNYWYSMHELSRMDDEIGDPLPGDRRLAPIPVGFTVRSGGTQWLFENSVRTTNPEELWK